MSTMTLDQAVEVVESLVGNCLDDNTAWRVVKAHLRRDVKVPDARITDPGAHPEQICEDMGWNACREAMLAAPSNSSEVKAPDDDPKSVKVPISTLMWWRQLSVDNPIDIWARIDQYLIPSIAKGVSLEIATKTYPDGTTATGIGPLPDKSPTPVATDGQGGEKGHD